MELLELLRKSHSLVLDKVNALESAGPERAAVLKAAKSQIEGQLLIERDYIFSEVQTTSRSTQNTLKLLEQQQQTIRSMLDAAAAQADFDVNLLRQSWGSYFDLIRDRLLSDLRQQLTTSEREELAQVVEDALLDHIGEAGAVAAV